MGFLKTNYDEVGGFGALPIGEYECFVSEVKIAETSTKKNMVKVTLTVRDDVDQEGKKRKFFDNIVEQDNMMWKFQQVSKAAALPVGMDIETLADFADAIRYKAVRVKNKHEEYNGEKQDRIAFWMESKFGGSQDNSMSENGSIDISDDDLPF
jgi:hypothetical protein